MTATMTAKITAPVLAGPLFRLRILKRRLAELIAEFAAAVVVGAASACPADTSAREAATSGEEGRGGGGGGALRGGVGCGGGGGRNRDDGRCADRERGSEFCEPDAGHGRQLQERRHGDRNNCQSSPLPVATVVS